MPLYHFHARTSKRRIHLKDGVPLPPFKVAIDMPTPLIYQIKRYGFLNVPARPLDGVEDVQILDIILRQRGLNIFIMALDVLEECLLAVTILAPGCSPLYLPRYFFFKGFGNSPKKLSISCP